ncbi:MAG: hypothetical protein JW750_00905 [Anaerolineaceae bacterium]|nr:hypothetical protein [Anaerolineaceae bacterium]
MLDQEMGGAAYERHLKGLYRIGGISALVMLALMVVQSVVFIIYPPPETMEEIFALFERNWLVGLLDFDLLYVIDNMLLIPIYFALFMAIRRTNLPMALFGLLLGLVGVAAYFPSAVPFELYTLSREYAAAASESQRGALLAAGEAMRAVYTGTTFNVYYVLNALVLLIFSPIMLRSEGFKKAHVYLGFAAGVLMAIPSSAGQIGFIFAFASLIPWVGWLVYYLMRMFALARE